MPNFGRIKGSSILLYQKRGFHYILVKLHLGGVSETNQPGNPEKNNAKLSRTGMWPETYR